MADRHCNRPPMSWKGYISGILMLWACFLFIAFVIYIIDLMYTNTTPVQTIPSLSASDYVSCFKLASSHLDSDASSSAQDIKELFQSADGEYITNHCLEQYYGFSCKNHEIWFRSLPQLPEFARILQDYFFCEDPVCTANLDMILKEARRSNQEL